MREIVTLELPEHVVRSARAVAATMHRRVEDVLEAIRKLSITIEYLSSYLLAVMKRGVATRSKPVQHQMDVT